MPHRVTSPPRIYPSLSGDRVLPLGAGLGMAYRVQGPVTGQPWLVLHGGPGSGGNPGLLQPFDPARHRAILPDQRGSGRSRPRGSTRRNTLDTLVGDLEALRHHLGVVRWSVLGGSWGATLALRYAARHPEAVEHLVLRGTFDAQPRTVQRLFRRFAPPAPGFQASPRHRTPLHRLSQLLQHGTMSVTHRRTLTQWNRMEALTAAHGARRAWRHSPTAAARAPQHRHWAGLQRQSRRPTDWRTGQALAAKFRIQAHFLLRHCGMRPGDWSRQLQRIAQAGIPCDFIHGQHDAVCPPHTSREAHRQMNQIRPGIARLHHTCAGHLGTDPDNARALRDRVHALLPPTAP